MKNNEIMISARFVSDELSDELSFLVINDITLKSLIEAIYYGLSKSKDGRFKRHFELLEKYLKTRKQLQVLYNAKGEFKVIDFTKTITRKDHSGEQKVSVMDGKLNELGFVTSSVLLFTLDPEVNPCVLFKSPGNSYILQGGENLEYNISTRRLNVLEDAVIDILPPGDMPQRGKQSYLDVIIPTVLSTGGMMVARLVTQAFSGGNSAMGGTMLMMTGAMAVVTFVTTSYNYLRQRNEHKKSVEEWVENYEQYIARKIETIKKWQNGDIKYLKAMYPEMDTLFANTAEIERSIFSRSQNDKDFMRITLGTSREVEPLFEIKAEKRDAISYAVQYKKVGDEIKIIVPRPEKKWWHWWRWFEKKKTPEQIAEENKGLSLLTDLPYDFANYGEDEENPNEVRGFRYLHSDEDVWPPLLVDLGSCGALGVISDDEQTSLNFVQHVIFELAYYHSPEDVQFVFFFDSKYADRIKKLEEKLAKLEQDKASRAQIAEVRQELRQAQQAKQHLVENYRYLPHANELFDDATQFVFDKDSSGIVFGKLLSIMNERVKTRSDAEDDNTVEEKQTQIVCVVLDDYNIKETGFSKFLPEVPKEGEPYVNKNGLTFLFVQDRKDKLPKYCGNTVEIDSINPGRRTSALRYNVISRESLNLMSVGEKQSSSEATSTDSLIKDKRFQNKYIFEDARAYQDQFALAFKQLSAIYYTRVAENGKVPSMVTLFELWGFNSDGIKNDVPRQAILANWKKVYGDSKDKEEYDITRNLRVAVGKNEHGPVHLDLYEKADGPHMLVAGTTGSGKSETIITYLIGLCMKFSPMDLNLMLVDMKGGGFSDRLGNLPHCVGAVTDTAGEDEGTSAAYMLKRFLQSLNAEIKRRKLLLTSLGVDNVDAYIRALRLIKKIKENEKDPNKQSQVESDKKKLNEKQREALKQDVDKLKPLSHLVLVVDEFTELKRFSSESNDVDFIAEITTIARVGRTLGFHIVLVSQNIEGAITDDIRVNSKARICLKVATKQASKEMIGSPVAAAPTMPLNGRAYLLVGTGSRFEYFQSAYTGANKNLNIEEPVELTEVPHSGMFNKKFYTSRKDNAKEIKRNENVSEHDTQLAYITKTIIEIGKNEERPEAIFLPPLPGKIADDTEWSDV